MPRPEAGLPSAGRPRLLELIELRRRYGEVVALDGISFAVAPGQMFGFVGPNGAGKTSAMRIVVGVLEPDSGRVLWRGRPVDARARARFGYMPEERGLYPKMRVRRQLSYLAQLHGLDAGAAGRAADHWIERLGVEDRAGDRVEELSLGNQQRVQLAAALVHDPDLLVLDEPFSGLDPIGVDALSEVLSERARAGVPVLFSSHQLDLVERLCDAVAIVSRGRVVAAGGVDELRARRGRRTLRVGVRGEVADWAAGLRGVEVLERAGDELLLALHEHADDQAVLDAARRAGSVTLFAFERQTLAELFREVVEGEAGAGGRRGMTPGVSAPH